MTLSVVIPFYNHKQYLDECLQAIVTQSRVPDECLIIDDGSTDHSESLLQEYCAKYPFIKVFRNEKNLGVHATVNRGVELAKGDWVVLSAADDQILPGFFEECMKAVATAPEIGLCCGDFCTFEDQKPYRFTTIRVLPVRHAIVLSPQEVVTLSRTMDFVIGSNASLYRRDLLLRYGLYDASLKSLADVYLCYQIALRHPICYLPKPLSAYRYVAQCYGNQIRLNFKLRAALFSALLTKIWKKEDPLFKKRFYQSGLLSFGGYFLLFFLALRPAYWMQFLRLAPKIFRMKVKEKLRKKEGNFGPLSQRLFFQKAARRSLQNFFCEFPASKL